MDIIVCDDDSKLCMDGLHRSFMECCFLRHIIVDILQNGSIDNQRT